VHFDRQPRSFVLILSIGGLGITRGCRSKGLHAPRFASVLAHHYMSPDEFALCGLDLADTIGENKRCFCVAFSVRCIPFTPFAWECFCVIGHVDVLVSSRAAIVGR